MVVCITLQNHRVGKIIIVKKGLIRLLPGHIFRLVDCKATLQYSGSE